MNIYPCSALPRPPAHVAENRPIPGLGAGYEGARMTLVVRGQSANSVFGLLGNDENSATFALGWVLEHSPALLGRLVEDVLGRPTDVGNAFIHLQKHRENGGFTDIEVIAAP